MDFGSELKNCFWFIRISLRFHKTTLKKKMYDIKLHNIGGQNFRISKDNLFCKSFLLYNNWCRFAEITCFQFHDDKWCPPELHYYVPVTDIIHIYRNLGFIFNKIRRHQAGWPKSAPESWLLRLHLFVMDCMRIFLISIILCIHIAI